MEQSVPYQEGVDLVTSRYQSDGPVPSAPPQRVPAQMAGTASLSVMCPTCGDILPRWARFCGHCAQPLTHSSVLAAGSRRAFSALTTPDTNLAHKKARKMSIALTGKLSFLHALSSRPFALLWSGQTVSALGDGAFTTAVAWQVLLLTGSATAMGLMVLAQTLPMILFLLVGGVVADRFPRKQVMLISDASRALAVLVIAVLAMTHVLQLWHLVVLGLFFGVVRGLFMPASQAVIPHLVEKDQLASANSLSELSYQLNALVGPLIGAGCVSLAGPTAAFGFDGLTFLFSASCLLLLRLPAVARAQTHAPAVAALEEVRTSVAQMRAGLGYVARSPFLWLTMALAALSSVGGAGALQVALPKLVHDVYGQGVWLLGVIWAAGGVGTMLAILLTPSVNRLRQRGVVLYLTMASTGLALITFALPLPQSVEPTVACIAMAVLTCGMTVHEVMWVTLLQERVPDETLGRVSSINQLAGSCLWPLGFVLSGALADRVTPTVVFLGAGLVTVMSYVLGLSARSIRQAR